MNTRFRAVRKALGLSQTELGKKFGVGYVRISNLEAGRDKPGEGFIYRFCHELNVNRAWLETGEGEMFNPPPKSSPVDEERIIHDFCVRFFKSLPEPLLRVITDALAEYLEEKSEVGKDS